MPTYLRGYKVGEFVIKCNEAERNLFVKVNKLARNWNVSNVVAFYPKNHIADKYTGLPIFPPFIPDTQCYQNQVTACIHRFGCRMPQLGNASDLFVEYSRIFILRHVRKLKMMEIETAGSWLDHASYPGARKEALRKLIHSQSSYDDDTAACKSFIKWEGYMEPKNPRAINSYSDLSKVILGPLIHAMDKALFSLPFFVKGTNPSEWPDKLHEIFGDLPVMGTDFSSFEAHHRGKYSGIIHFWVMHSLRDLGLEPSTLRLLSKLILGTNTIKFKTCTATIPQRLMSGALWTSSSNSLLNFLMLSFLTSYKLYGGNVHVMLDNIFSFKGIFEGDDGLCVASSVDEKLMEEIGLGHGDGKKLKFDFYKNYSTASFCGIVVNSSEGEVITDPIKVIRNFCVLEMKYAASKPSVHLSLLRAKAMSYKYLYGNCPIIGVMCDHYLKLTRSITANAIKSETKHWLLRNVSDEVLRNAWKKPFKASDSSRELMSSVFNIPVATQLEMENVIKTSGDVIHLDISAFMGRAQVEHMCNNLYANRVIPNYSCPVPQNVIDIQLHSMNKPTRHDRNYGGTIQYLDG